MSFVSNLAHSLVIEWENVYHSHEKQNEWHKNNQFICQIVLPPYKLAERDRSWQDK
jgi:hypothetical protein